LLDRTKEDIAGQLSEAQVIVQTEAVKIKAAIRADFILSIEIIVITLETVIDQILPIQIMVVSFIALLATVGVYGFVALLVRLDDVGSYLIKRSVQLKGLGARSLRLSGEALVASLPKVIRILAVIGAVAMLVVGGGMFVHNIDAVHFVLAFLPSLLADLVSGLIVGSALFLGLQVYNHS
jgi:predicted DNA repair protein MutK